MPIAINGLSPGPQEGQLLYTLNTPDISGIFLLREGDYFEQRIFHSADHRVAQVCALPGQDQIAFVLRQRDGGASIAVMTSEGKEFTEITQGDSIDEFPHWVPGRPGAAGLSVRRNRARCQGDHCSARAVRGPANRRGRRRDERLGRK